MPTPSKNSITVLGIDPGYDRVGWAVGTLTAGQWSNIQHGCLTTDATQELTARYWSLHQQLKAIISQYTPQVAAIESLFFFKNQTTALKVSEARGVVINTCQSHNLEIVEFTPLQIKQAATGYGKADKKAVDKMVRLQLKLGSEKIIDDAMDALAILLTYQARHKLARAAAIA